MNSSTWAYFFIVMGILGMVIINTSSNLLMTNEQDYYILKEVTEAAMIDAIDYRAYREGLGYDGVTTSTDPESMHCITGVPGTVRILKEKFVENFTYRFANAVDMAKKYKIVVNNVQECPPKVTITLVSTHAFDFVDVFTDADVGEAEIVNRITAILEEKPGDYEPGYNVPIDEPTTDPDPTPTPTPVIPTPTPTDNTNTLAVDANEGKGGGTWEQKAGTTKPVSVSRDGYKFKGWTKSGTCGAIGSGTNFTYRYPNSNRTICMIKANWEEIKISNTLVVDANQGKGGGTWTKAPKDTQSVSVSRDGYTFNGWVKGTNCGTIGTNAKFTYKYPNTNGTTCTIKARWKINQNTLVVDDNGGKGGGSWKKAYGDTKSISVSRNGYTFTGWSKSGKCGTYSNEANTTYTYPATNETTCTLKANWKEIKNKLIVDANGGIGGGTFEQKPGTSKQVLVYRNNWSFNGWTKSGDCGTIKNNQIFIYKFPQTEGTTCKIKAKWYYNPAPDPEPDDDPEPEPSPAPYNPQPSPQPPSDGGFCFLAGTKINTLFGYVNIEEIKPGSMVLTYNEKLQKNEYNKVLALIIHENVYDKLYYLTVEGQDIEVAQDHPLYIKNEDGIRWKKARVLKVGDSVMFSDGTFHKIDNIRYELIHETEYNISVENTHNYYVSFGNDILVHNAPPRQHLK